MINFNLSAEIDDDINLTNAQAMELLSKMEDLIIQTSLDLYDSEYEIDEE
jgi:hypothetical protein